VITAFFIAHLFLDRLGAVVTGSGFIETTVQTNVEIFAAALADLVETGLPVRDYRRAAI
jgi:hypothetical protein